MGAANGLGHTGVILFQKYKPPSRQHLGAFLVGVLTLLCFCFVPLFVSQAADQPGKSSSTEPPPGPTFLLSTPQGDSIPNSFRVAITKDVSKAEPITARALRLNHKNCPAEQPKPCQTLTPIDPDGVVFTLQPATGPLKKGQAVVLAVALKPNILWKPGIYDGTLVLEADDQTALSQNEGFTIIREAAILALSPVKPTLLVYRICPIQSLFLGYRQQTFPAHLLVSGGPARVHTIEHAHLSIAHKQSDGKLDPAGLTHGKMTATFHDPNNLGAFATDSAAELDLTVEGLSIVGKYVGTFRILAEGTSQATTVDVMVIVTDSRWYLALVIFIGVLLSLLSSRLVRQHQSDTESVRINNLRLVIATAGLETSLKARLLNRLDRASEALWIDDLEGARQIRASVQEEYNRANPTAPVTTATLTTAPTPTPAAPGAQQPVAQAQEQILQDHERELKESKKRLWLLDVGLSALALLVGTATGLLLQDFWSNDYFGTPQDYLLGFVWGFGLDKVSKITNVKNLFLPGIVPGTTAT